MNKAYGYKDHIIGKEIGCINARIDSLTATHDRNVDVTNLNFQGFKIENKSIRSSISFLVFVAGITTTWIIINDKKIKKLEKELNDLKED